MRRISSHVPFGVLAALLALLFAAGCATTVRPEAKPLDPVPVFLTDYGVHSSLMLPTPDGRYVEYSFGDFGYAALNHGGPHNALGALLVSNQSGIGRRFLTVRPGEETPRPAYAPKSFQKFFANRFEVYGIVKELDLRYRRGAGEQDPVHNPITDAVFVKDTEHYGIANNCNHMTARILRELGCVVKGNTGVSSFKVIGMQQLPPQVDVGTYAQATPVAPAPAQQSTPAARTAAYTRIDLGN
jgi:hypothetical protein